jgi:hypothetical protein
MEDIYFSCVHMLNGSGAKWTKVKDVREGLKDLSTTVDVVAPCLFHLLGSFWTSTLGPQACHCLPRDHVKASVGL